MDRDIRATMKEKVCNDRESFADLVAADHAREAASQSRDASRAIAYE
jgi:hypothetical protein